jgi:hypothetical protein
MATLKKPPTKSLIAALSHEIRKKTNKAKLETLDRACLDGSVTDTEFRHLYALLEKFHSTDSGKCHPSDAKLGMAAGGKCARTAGPLPEPLPKNKASPSPREGTASASLKKENGQQEGQGEMRDISPKAQAVPSRLAFPKRFPREKKEFWKAEDGDRELTEAEQREYFAIVPKPSGGER